MKKQKFNIPVKLISIILIILLALYFVISYIWKVMMTADYFKIKDIITRGTDSVTFSYLKGKSIFSLDLNKESRYILGSFPECSRINLIRVLPDRIFVDFIMRKPVAYLKLYRYFAVDKDAVIFNAASQPENSYLPIITGLETRIFGPKTGRKYNVKELWFALEAIKEIKKDRILKQYDIKRIDVTSLDNTSVFICPEQIPTGYMNRAATGGPPFVFEIKLNQGNFKDKISILANFLIQQKLDLGNIKYIDLRFKEPVVKFKEIKQ